LRWRPLTLQADRVIERTRWSATVAALLVAPALLFVGANLMKHGLGVNVLSDALGPFAEPRDGALEAIVTVLVLVGPVAGLVLALASIVRLRFERSGAAVDATVSVRLQWTHIAVALSALAVLVVLGGYLVAENSTCWFGDATAC
jgi:heme/copper-type cytochrome/quinol oxidase subunit 2